MVAALLIVLGALILIATGFGKHRGELQPQWWGWALIVLGVTWPLLTAHIH